MASNDDIQSDSAHDTSAPGVTTGYMSIEVNNDPDAAEQVMSPSSTASSDAVVVDRADVAAVLERAPSSEALTAFSPRPTSGIGLNGDGAMEAILWWESKVLSLAEDSEVRTFLHTKEGLQRVHEGVPSELRRRVWRRCTTAWAEFEEGRFERQWKQAESDPMTTAVDDISKDLHRTFPNIELFQSEEGRAMLGRVLVAYSLQNPEVGYCQSMNFVAALFIIVMDNEESAYYLLSHVIERILPHQYFSGALTGFQVDVHVLESLMDRHMPALLHRMHALGVSLTFLCPPWFMCLFANTLPYKAVLRIWDQLLVEGSVVLFRVALAAMYRLRKVWRLAPGAIRDDDDDDGDAYGTGAAGTGAAGKKRDSDSTLRPSSIGADSNVDDDAIGPNVTPGTATEMITTGGDEHIDDDDEEELIGPEVVRNISQLIAMPHNVDAILRLAVTRFGSITQDEIDSHRATNLDRVLEQQARIKKQREEHEASRRENVARVQRALTTCADIAVRLRNPSFAAIRSKRPVSHSSLVSKSDTLILSLRSVLNHMTSELANEADKQMFKATAESLTASIDGVDDTAKLFASGAIFDEGYLLREIAEDLRATKDDLPEFLCHSDMRARDDGAYVLLSPGTPIHGAGNTEDGDSNLVEKFGAQIQDGINQSLRDVQDRVQTVSDNIEQTVNQTLSLTGLLPSEMAGDDGEVTSHVHASFDELLSAIDAALVDVPALRHANEVLTEVGVAPRRMLFEKTPLAQVGTTIETVGSTIGYVGTALGSTVNAVGASTLGLFKFGGGGKRDGRRGGSKGRADGGAATGGGDLLEMSEKTSAETDASTSLNDTNDQAATGAGAGAGNGSRPHKLKPKQTIADAMAVAQCLVVLEKLRQENAGVRFPSCLDQGHREVVLTAFKDAVDSVESVAHDVFVKGGSVIKISKSVVAQWAAVPEDRLFFTAVGARVRHGGKGKNDVFSETLPTIGISAGKLHRSTTVDERPAAEVATTPARKAAASKHGGLPSGPTSEGSANDDSVRAKGAPPAAELWLVVWHNLEAIRSLPPLAAPTKQRSPVGDGENRSDASKRLSPDSGSTRGNAAMLALQEVLRSILSALEREIELKRGFDAVVSDLERLQTMCTVNPTRFIIDQALRQLPAIEDRVRQLGGGGEHRSKVLSFIAREKETLECMRDKAPEAAAVVLADGSVSVGQDGSVMF